MELHQLEIFRMAAETLNFTKTAERMNYAQSNITKHIGNLEKELSVKLFERLGKNLYLTAEGKIFLAHAKELLLRAEYAQGVVSPQQAQGVIHLGAAETLCVNRLPTVFLKYQRIFPHMKIHLHMESCHQLCNMIRDNSIDIAMVLTDKIEETDMIARRLYKEKMCFVVAPTHYLSDLPTITPYDLKNECLIITTEGCGYRPLILEMLRRYGVKPQSMMELASIGAIKSCVMCGLGVAFLPRISVQDEIVRGNLQVVPLGFEIFNVYTMLFYHRDKWLSPPLQRFIDICK